MNETLQTPSDHTDDWFASLIEHSNDLITVVDTDDTIQYQSPSAERVIGYPPEELVGDSFRSFVHPDDTETIRETFGAVDTVNARSVSRVEYRFRRGDGSWAWLESTVSTQSADAIDGLVINSRDVTPRKESQQQAAVLNRVLRHNLRNRLNVVIAHTESLREHTDSSVAETAATLHSNLVELYETTDQSRDVAEILDAPEDTHRPQDLAALLSHRVETLGEAHPETEIACDLPDEQCVIGTAKLDIALDQLLDNAIKHNDADEPWVSVQIEPPSQRSEFVTAVVEDNGPGIPDHEREVLTSAEETPLQHSNGLGLWVVNWIATRSGGHIEVTDRSPRGSRVLLHLRPVDRAD